MNELPDHVRRNRTAWDEWAKDYVAAGERAWAQQEPSWGIWGVPEAKLGVLPTDLAGKDTIELGCGTAYVSAWMARRGARVVGIDNSEAQLATARRLQREHGLDFPLHHGNAETVPYPAGVSISPSQNTVRVCGPTPIAGFRRRRVCCVPTAA